MTRFRFNEGSGGEISGDIVDRNGDAIPVAQITDATLTLYDMMTFVPGGSPAVGIINGRQAQDILNNNDVTIDDDGHFVWSLQADDNIVVTERRQIERHRAWIRFAWDGGDYVFECEIEVVNLRGGS